jgi:hypothetical protein
MLFVSSRVLLTGDQVDDERLRARDEHAERDYAARTEGAPADQAAAIAMDISRARLRDEGELALEAPMTGGLQRAEAGGG